MCKYNTSAKFVAELLDHPVCNYNPYSIKMDYVNNYK